MRKCVRKGTALALGLGLLAGFLLPDTWVAVIALVLLVVILFVTRRCNY